MPHPDPSSPEAIPAGDAQVDLLAELTRIVSEIYREWDADRDSRVGKMLSALAGHAGYRADIDALRSALSARSPETDHWVTLGDMLLSGGMYDPAFLVGMVRGMLASRASAPTEGQMHPADQDLPDEIIQNGVNLRVIKQAYDWLLDDDGSIHGLTAGDHGFEPTGIKLSMADLVALAQPSPSSDATITRTPLSSEFRETVARNIDIGKQAGKPAAEPQP